MAPISGIAGALTDLLVLPPGVPEVEPNVCPLPEKEALDLAGPLAASAAAERTAVRRAVAFAPRTVSFTEEPLRTRNVGILQAAVSLDLITLVYPLFHLRRYAINACYISLLVHIDFTESHTSRLRLGSGELLKDGGDDLAWSAPIGVEVHDGVG